MPFQLGSWAISVVHCVMASTNTRSKNSSRGSTPSPSRSTSPRWGRCRGDAVIRVSLAPSHRTGQPYRPAVPSTTLRDLIERQGPVRFDVAVDLMLYGPGGFFETGQGAGRRAD